MKILTVEQLAKFCFENKMYKFDASESGYKLCVQTPSVFKFEEENNDSILYGNIKLLHTNTNRNHSNVTKEAAENCLSTIKYKPVLANFTTIDDDGTEDFTSHDMEINEDGSVNYIEHQIGCFTSDEPYLEYDKDTDRYYIYAKVAIPREYSSAASIIERKNGTKCSAELFVNRMSYDAKNRELLLEDIEVMGVTLLGTNPETGEEVQEGMEGARVDIADFSVSNSVKFEQNDKLIETLDKLNETLSNFNIQTESTKGGNQKEMNKFEELMQKYNKTIEDITFEYEGLSDEELEAKFAEIFEEPKKKLEDDDAPAATEDETPAEDSKPVENEPASTPEEPEEEPAPTPVEPENNDNTDDNNGETFESNNNFSIELDGVKREFAISLNDKQIAIDTLVNDTYGESDNDYFYSDVYEDSKTVVMHGLFSGKHYRQSYKEKKGVYSLSGDRVSVFAQYLTQDEIDKLDAMKSNYSSIEEKLAKYEAEPEKIQILESADYSFIADKAEFAELKKQENHFDLSVDELKAKADEIILSYAKAGQLNFSANEEEKKPVVGMKKFATTKTSTKRSRYGGLGKKED